MELTTELIEASLGIFGRTGSLGFGIAFVSRSIERPMRLMMVQTFSFFLYFFFFVFFSLCLHFSLFELLNNLNL